LSFYKIKETSLIGAHYNKVTNVYNYGFDVAGNLVNNNGLSRTYNAANQMLNDGTNTLDYDDNGNLLEEGVNNYAWDRPNRLLSIGNTKLCSAPCVIFAMEHSCEGIPCSRLK
jgi:hypothetical protein